MLPLRFPRLSRFSPFPSCRDLVLAASEEKERKLTFGWRLPSFEDFAYQHDWFMHCPSRSTRSFTEHLIEDDAAVAGCECACPKAGDLQGRKPGQELVNMGQFASPSSLVQSLVFPYSSSPWVADQVLISAHWLCRRYRLAILVHLVLERCRAESAGRGVKGIATKDEDAMLLYERVSHAWSPTLFLSRAIALGKGR